MIRIRPYKSCDAAKIVQWVQDEDVFHKWGGDRFGSFPITSNHMHMKYREDNGDCIQPDNFYPVVALDEEEVVGHFIMRYIHNDPRYMRFGWAIVDNTKRGKGYGKDMLKLGLKVAFEVMHVNVATIGVFENNPQAIACYKSVGFHEHDMKEPESALVKGETWNIIELEITKEEYEAIYCVK